MAAPRPVSLTTVATNPDGHEPEPLVVVGSINDLLVPETFIADPTGGATVDAEARAAIADILDLLIAQGLMASA